MLKKIFSCAAFVCLLCACSETPKEREVTVSNVDISGFISSYVKVVDGTYKFANNGTDGAISVKFELVAKPDVKYYCTGSLELNAIGENGEIFDTGSLKFESFDTSKMQSLLKGNIGDTKTISFERKYITDEPICKSIFTNAVSFEVIDHMCEPMDDSVSESSSTKSDVSESNTLGSEDWDKALDDYEAYVDSYIKLLKKAQAGDMSAMTEYLTCLEKAEAFGKKFDNAKGSMSTKQIKRYTDITMKITTAAMP